MTRGRLREETLYPRIERFLRNRMNCRYSGLKCGAIDVGTVDVIGVKEFQETFSNRYEIIGVEVKKRDFNFGKVIGQTLAYSLIAHRIYLACFTEFSDSQIDLASRLGVGLIKINPRSGCSRVLSSHLFVPEREKMLRMLDKMNLAECMFCGGLMKEKYTCNLPTAYKQKRPYQWRRTTTSNRRQWLYLCQNCVALFGKHYDFSNSKW